LLSPLAPSSPLLPPPSTFSFLSSPLPALHPPFYYPSLSTTHHPPFTVPSKKYPAHKIILSTCSKIFSDLFSEKNDFPSLFEVKKSGDQISEISVTGLNPDFAKKWLKAIYTGDGKEGGGRREEEEGMRGLWEEWRRGRGR
jgi:hypothetical protein